ncbi:MAG: PEP-CTERM sorting domain-containing protein [bacterium]|nr:PEP-CTERM sorting domain-containing protein [bacterium]
MTLQLTFRAFSALCALAFPAHGFADVIYTESVSGDLSGNMSSPTLLNPLLGLNTIIGQVGNNGNTGASNGSDADYFTFTIQPGYELTTFTIDSYTFSPSDPGSSFMGYRAGSSFAGQQFGDIDSFVLFNASSGDVIGNLSNMGKLGAGQHAFWVQETSPSTVNYSMSFSVSAVPEPTTFGMLCLVVTHTAFVRRRSRKGDQ